MHPSAPANNTLHQRHGFAALVVIIGIVIGQAVLYGPSLIGKKVFLPLDILAQPGVFIPQTPELGSIEPYDPSLSDLIYSKEPERRFLASELRKGNMALWNPDRFAGAPCVTSKTSPFILVEALTESPIAFAWRELLEALLAGTGMYFFCRQVLACSPLASIVAGWCYPLTGFLVLWQGYELKCNVCWLPWLLAAVHGTAQNRSRWYPLGLAFVTYAIASAGQIDVAGQVLFVSGLFGLFSLLSEYHRTSSRRTIRHSVLGLAAGWGIGLMLASPQLFPAIEYAQVGYRTTTRSQGAEERPPGGLGVLPQIAFPDYYGRSTRGSAPTSPYKPNNLQESAGGAYAGLIALMFAAPLAFGERRDRSTRIILGVLALIGVGWWLNLIPIVALLRLPGLNMMSHNRLVFVTSFAVLALAAKGLDSLSNDRITGRRWQWLPFAVLVGLAIWCCYRSYALPAGVRTIEAAVNSGNYSRWAANLEEVLSIKESYASYFRHCALVCLVAAMCWGLFWIKKLSSSQVTFMVAALLLLELGWFAHGRRPQCDQALYYPKIPALERLQHSIPGRVIGNDCLGANLASMAGLRDIRGYDAIDPKELVELLRFTAAPRSSILEYAYTQFLIPEMRFSPQGQVKLHPILDMLNVRYVIGRGQPMTNAQPLFESVDYYVLENTNALPRAFIPASVEIASVKDRRLDLMKSWDFDPRKTAYVETPITLPQHCRGEVEIVEDSSMRVRLNAKLETAGLVVLADLWDRGWHATLNGSPAEILRVNHAVRGVLAPPGEATIDFVYAPAGFKWGLRLAGAALGIMAAWGSILFVRQRKLAQS